MNFWRRVGLLGLSFSGGMAWLWPSGETLRHPAITSTAIVAMVAWTWGTAELLLSTSNRRWVWLTGSLLMLNHLAAAFHFGHHWSQQHALEHTLQTSGVAEGLYVNYAFVLVWLADALWLMFRERTPFKRPRWLTWAVQGFLVFIVFNATMIYGSWPTRVLGVLMFFSLGMICRQRHNFQVHLSTATESEPR